MDKSWLLYLVISATAEQTRAGPITQMDRNHPLLYLPNNAASLSVTTYQVEICIWQIMF